MLSETLIKEIKVILFRFFDPKKDRVFIFGSRATGKSRKFSDIDIGIISKEKISWRKLMAIEERLEDSDLPYTFDLVDFSTVSKNFKKVAGKDVINLN